MYEIATAPGGWFPCFLVAHNSRAVVLAQRALTRASAVAVVSLVAGPRADVSILAQLCHPALKEMMEHND